MIQRVRIKEKKKYHGVFERNWSMLKIQSFFGQWNSLHLFGEDCCVFFPHVLSMQYKKFCHVTDYISNSCMLFPSAVRHLLLYLFDRFTLNLHPQKSTEAPPISAEFKCLSSSHPVVHSTVFKSTGYM